MNDSSTPVGNWRETIRGIICCNSSLFLAEGAVLTLLGLVALAGPQVSNLDASIYVGWVLLVSGISGLVMVAFVPNTAGFAWALLTGALALSAGVLLLWHPAGHVVPLQLVLGAFFVAEGLFQIASAFAYRVAFPRSWTWMLASGVVDLILAGLIITGLLGVGGWALGLTVGVSVITSGSAIMLVAATVIRERIANLGS